MGSGVIGTPPPLPSSDRPLHSLLLKLSSPPSKPPPFPPLFSFRASLSLFSGRSLPLAKTSAWVTARHPLERLRPPGPGGEVLLAAAAPASPSPNSNPNPNADSDSGRGSRRPPPPLALLEGLVTNFFVVVPFFLPAGQREKGKDKGEKGEKGEPGAGGSPFEGWALQTAPAHDSPANDSGGRVLPGAARDAVLRACARVGLRVVLRAPRLDESSTWREAFLTSAPEEGIGIASSLSRVPRLRVSALRLDPGPLSSIHLPSGLSLISDSPLLAHSDFRRELLA